MVCGGGNVIQDEELNEMSNEACTCEDWCSASVHGCTGPQGLALWAHCPPVAVGTIKLSLHSTQSGLGKGTEIACAIISPCYSPSNRKQVLPGRGFTHPTSAWCCNGRHINQ